MAELFSQVEQRDSHGADWVLRIAIAALFAVFGLEKFSSDPHWLHLFREIGAGDWFRYFTGVVEVAGAALVLIPRSARLGLGLLACTMSGAAAIVAIKLHQGSDALFPGAIAAALILFTALRKSGNAPAKVFERPDSECAGIDHA